MNSGIFKNGADAAPGIAIRDNYKIGNDPYLRFPHALQLCDFISLSAISLHFTSFFML